MAVTELIIAGRPVRYLRAGQRLDQKCLEVVKGFDVFEDQELEDHSRRRVLTTLSRRPRLFYGVLHWSDGTDLAGLDRRSSTAALRTTTLSAPCWLSP